MFSIDVMSCFTINGLSHENLDQPVPKLSKIIFIKLKTESDIKERDMLLICTLVNQSF